MLVLTALAVPELQYPHKSSETDWWKNSDGPMLPYWANKAHLRTENMDTPFLLDLTKLGTPWRLLSISPVHPM